MRRHRGAFEYDWRARFRMPLSEVGQGMSWGEAWRLTRVLLSEPSTQVAAAVGKWEHPASREWLLLADIFDQLRMSAWSGKGQKPKPYPRPMVARKRIVGTPMAPARLRAVLDAHREAGV